MMDTTWHEARSRGLVIWERDDSPTWEVDMSCLVQRPTGEVDYVRATGCSCWSGEAWIEQTYANIQAALNPVHGVPADMRDDAFRALMELFNVAEPEEV